MNTTPRTRGLPEPYYSDDAVTIYHGDCREILPYVSGDVLVTDPPYGIGWTVEAGGERSRSRRRRGMEFPLMQGDDRPFEPGMLLCLGLPSVIFGANHFANALPASPSWIVWDKRVHMASTDQADCEMAWTNLGGPARIFRQVWNGGIRPEQDRESRKQWGVMHPTQKPLSLMRWTIGRCPPGVVLDPYIGSGTTLRAAKDLGRKAVGIEIEERYCEIAAARCAQEVLDLGAPAA